MALPLVLAREEEAFRRLLRLGTPSAFLLLLLGPILHVPLLFLAGPLLAAVHLLVLRLTLLRDAARLLAGGRRLAFRWGTRLAVLGLGSAAYSLSALPLAGALLGAAGFAGLTAAVHLWARRALRDERERQPLALWEKLVVWLLALLVAAGLAALLALGLLVRLLAQVFGSP